MNSNPPVFIAMKLNGNVISYVRADQIEAIHVIITGHEYNMGIRTQVRTRSGFNAFTEDTLDQVFAKMADALNIEVES